MLVVFQVLKDRCVDGGRVGTIKEYSAVKVVVNVMNNVVPTQIQVTQLESVVKAPR